ncbi:MAG: DUF371 domain-containing protein [Candidatus Altiarchaeota archaeon]|nr:DUF371 domain-containing protein [Candidatus Altiarchaeota archaeon]
MLTEEIKAKGHKNVRARHKTTLEITRDDHLTLQGDCIIAVSADKGLPDFSEEFREALKNERTRLEIRIICEGMEEKITAYGHPALSFTNPHEMVVRKSGFICGRTLAIKADKSAAELDREIVNKLSRCCNVMILLKLSSP